MTRCETGSTKQELDADTPVENLKVVNQKYAYHPDPNKLRTPDGQIVDFVVAKFEIDGLLYLTSILRYMTSGG